MIWWMPDHRVSHPPVLRGGAPASRRFCGIPNLRPYILTYRDQIRYGNMVGGVCFYWVREPGLSVPNFLVPTPMRFELERPNSVCRRKRGGACLYGWSAPAIQGGEDLASPNFWTPSNPHAEDMQQRTLHDDQSGWKENVLHGWRQCVKKLCDTNADARYLCGS